MLYLRLVLLVALPATMRLCAGPDSSPDPAATAAVSEAPAARSWKLVQTINNSEIPEPSGLAWCSARNSVFAVDDGDTGDGRPSALLELDMEGKTLQRTILGQDLEAVCFSESDGLVYAADEHKDTIHVVHPDGLKLQKSFRLDGKIDGETLFKPGGNGIEGIAAVSGGQPRLLVLNQEKPFVVLELPLAEVAAEQDGGKIEPVRWWEYAPFNAGELHVDTEADELWVVHSWLSNVEVYTLSTMEPLRMDSLPGEAQEGLTIDGTGRLWIGQDTGGILIYERDEPAG